MFTFFLIKIEWFVAIIRDIASIKNQGGYTKLIQMCFMFVLTFLFVIIVIYYLFNPEQVDRISIILTVIVGWLGLIIGRFFGESAMETLSQEQKVNVKELNEMVKEYRSVGNQCKDIIENILK